MGGRDFGLDPVRGTPLDSGFVNNFNLMDLHIGKGAHVLLTDLIDNGDRGGAGGDAEALYVNRLIFDDTTSTLNLNGLHLYYHTLQGNSGQIITTPIPEPAGMWILSLASVLAIRRRRHVRCHQSEILVAAVRANGDVLLIAQDEALHLPMLGGFGLDHRSISRRITLLVGLVGRKDRPPKARSRAMFRRPAAPLRAYAADQSRCDRNPVRDS